MLSMLIRSERGSGVALVTACASRDLRVGYLTVGKNGLFRTFEHILFVKQQNND